MSETSTQRSLKSTFVRVAPASLLVQVLSFGSSIVLATQLGASTRTDAYYLALSVPVVVYVVLLFGIRLGGIPALTKVRHKEPHEAFERGCSELVTATLFASMGLTLVVTGAMMFILPAAAGGSPELSSMTRVFLVELLPYAVSGAVIGALGSILAVQGSFAVATLVLAIEPALKSVLVLTFGHELGVQALVVGNVVGNLLAVTALWGMVHRQGIALRIVAFRMSPVVRSIFKLSAPLIIGQALLQLNPLIDRTTAASLGGGNITELELGLRLFTAPTALLTGMMVAPLAAGWSARLLEEGWPSVMQSFQRLVKAVTIIVPPLVVLGVVLRHEVVAFAYSSHLYTPTAVARTADVFGALLIGLIPMILTVPLATLFVIRGDTVFPMKVGIANCLLNAALDITLRGPLGVAGIALSTSVTYSLLCAVYVVEAKRRWGSLHVHGLRKLVPLAGISVAGAIGAYAALAAVFNTPSSRIPELAFMAGVGAMTVAIQVTVLSVGGGWVEAGIRLPALGRARRRAFLQGRARRRSPTYVGP